jgi:hypothetical protein|tara:strand:+ start:85 stop:462 length:378 start_codon:yes stop_codon:yes gene_type:complete
MPTVKTHITNHTLQKSYAVVEDCDTTPSENLLKNQTGRVFSMLLEYDNATTGYFKMYDAKGSVTHGTDHPIFVMPVKGTAYGCNVVSQQGILFSAGVSVAGSAKGGTGSGGAVPAGNIDVYITGS